MFSHRPISVSLLVNDQFITLFASVKVLVTAGTESQPAGHRFAGRVECDRSVIHAADVIQEKSSRLVFRKCSIDDLDRSTAIPERAGKMSLVRTARLMEQELAYHVEIGRYWEEVDRFDIEQVDRLDKTWLAALGARAQFSAWATGMMQQRVS